jgi:hypothetical protein
MSHFAWLQLIQVIETRAAHQIDKRDECCQHRDTDGQPALRPRYQFKHRCMIPYGFPSRSNALDLKRFFLAKKAFIPAKSARARL